jgi:CDP-glucose 4,6-dehydratase
MESLEMTTNFWDSKRVFITGHTGFKGGWLSLWLAHSGAQVHGFSLPPSVNHNFFSVCNIQDILTSHYIDDIRNRESIKKVVAEVNPEIVFHLAAQPLVRESYSCPVETFEINVLGTVNLLDALRNSDHLKAVVNVTTDKCYENQEWIWPYRENEPLGGHDPYSASKACSEIVSSAYRRSFLEAQGIALATARAGNVIGGGDWSKDRIIPDFLKASDTNKQLIIRSPNAVRPWQHVLEPVSGYLKLAERLYLDGNRFSGSWNFGPNFQDSKPVHWIADYLCSRIPSSSWSTDTKSNPHEANMLRLDSTKANLELDWQPVWNLPKALDKTIEWHEAWRKSLNMHDVCINQLQTYISDQESSKCQIN